MHVRFPGASQLLLGSLLLLGSACGAPESDPAADLDTSLYALVDGIDGVAFYPPLGPQPTVAGTFDASLLDGFAVTIESEDASGTITVLGTFTQNTQPAAALIAAQERYFVNVPAGAYITDPTLTYRIRALLDGSELGASVLSAHVFTVLAHNPALAIGVQVRVEGTGAVRNLPRTRQVAGAPLHCSNGRQDKDETGLDCGGGCVSCCIPTAEVCDGVDNDCDGVVDEGNPGGGVSCSTGMAAACATGTLQCSGGSLICTPNVMPSAEVCDGVDNDCNGAIDNGTCATNQVCQGAVDGTVNMYNTCYLVTSVGHVLTDGVGGMYTVFHFERPVSRYGDWIPVNNCTNRPTWMYNSLGYWPQAFRIACHH